MLLSEAMCRGKEEMLYTVSGDGIFTVHDALNVI